MPQRVGILVGRERSFPEALIAEVARRDQDVVAELATFDAVSIDAPLAYDVLVDRISHEVPCYQPVLKHAALFGARVINNPFFRIADDKFFNAALAARLGVAVPKTYVLPSKDYGDDITSGSLRNLRYPIAWENIVKDLGFPMYLKPHWGGGFRDVYRIGSLEELFKAYDRTGQKTMILQEGIEWSQYVRCIVIGQEEVRVAPWDPRQSHFDRYRMAAESMPKLTPALEARAAEDARKICRALGYDMNTVELAVAGDKLYAIDFMNSAPDFDISSLGEEHFAWTVERMASLVIRLAKEPRPERPLRWDAMLGGAL